VNGVVGEPSGSMGSRGELEESSLAAELDEPLAVLLVVSACFASSSTTSHSR